jgi:hypothetical protein
LLKDRHRIAASDDDTGGEIHRLMETLDRCNGLALKDEVVANGLHAEYPNATLSPHLVCSYSSPGMALKAPALKALFRFQSSPVMNCARPYPKDQSSSVF